MKEFFYKIFYFIGITIVGIIVYFMGNFLIGERNEGGKRLIVALVGIIFGALGYWMISSCGDALLHESFPDGLFAILGIVIFSFGVYLFYVAIFASQNRIKKWFDGILSGWNP
jgi:hypothetical protein